MTAIGLEVALLTSATDALPDALPVTSMENAFDTIAKLKDSEEVKHDAKAAHELMVDAMFAGIDHVNYERFTAGTGNQGRRRWLDQPLALEPFSVNRNSFERHISPTRTTVDAARNRFRGPNPRYHEAEKLDKNNRTAVVHAVDRRDPADQQARTQLIDETVNNGSEDHRLVLTISRDEVKALEPELRAALARHAKTVRMPRSTDFAEPILRATTQPEQSRSLKPVTHIGSLISDILREAAAGPHDISGLLNQRKALRRVAPFDTFIDTESLNTAARRILEAPARSK